MSLKEALAADIAIFLNPEEFGEIMEVNGVQVVALWDTSIAPHTMRVSSTDPVGWGIAAQNSVLFVSENDMPCPLVGERFWVAGEAYKVVQAKPEHGILRIELEMYTA